MGDDMKITYMNSQEIAERIGKILNHPINIMDETGRIVASTDTSRIGDIHTGAKELIEKNAHEIDIYIRKTNCQEVKTA